MTSTRPPAPQTMISSSVRARGMAFAATEVAKRSERRLELEKCMVEVVCKVNESMYLRKGCVLKLIMLWMLWMGSKRG